MTGDRSSQMLGIVIVWVMIAFLTFAIGIQIGHRAATVPPVPVTEYRAPN